MMHIQLTYDKAAANREQVLIKGRFAKADIFITRFEDRRFVVKDYSQKGFWERNLIGRVVIGREAGAYEALSGIEGLPPRFKRLSPCSFAIEYLEGRDLGDLARGEIGYGVIHQFERIIEALHSRGWVHLDLHRRKNILFVEGRVFVVDLASALHPGRVPIIGRYLTRLFGLADLLSLIKMKQIFSPELLTKKELRWLMLRNRIMPTKWDDK